MAIEHSFRNRALWVVMGEAERKKELSNFELLILMIG